MLLFHASHHPVKTSVETVPPHALEASDQLHAEHVVDLGTSVPAPAGVILVKSTTAATGAAAMEATPVDQILREKAHEKQKRKEEEDIEIPSEAAAIQDSPSGEESAESMEASWYQPHLHLSEKTKRFHKKMRRKHKDGGEDVEGRGEEDFKADQHVERKFHFRIHLKICFFFRPKNSYSLLHFFTSKLTLYVHKCLVPS